MPQIAAFPKCYMDELCITRSMSLFDWIEQAATLHVAGLELYPGFFTSLEPGYLAEVRAALEAIICTCQCCVPRLISQWPTRRGVRRKSP